MPRVRKQQIRQNEGQPSFPDPSLDFAYPVTWFPGVSDPAQAETIVLKAGDTRQADFHLVPIPSIHLKILSPPRTNNGPNGQPVPMFPIVQQVGGGVGFNPVMSRFEQQGQQGQIDVGGLTPGVYQIRLPGQNQEGRTALVEVSANSTRMLDMSAPPHDMARITLHFDSPGESDSGSRQERNGGLQVTLIDREGQLGSYSSNAGDGGGFVRGDRRERDADRTIEVPPGTV